MTTLKSIKLRCLPTWTSNSFHFLKLLWTIDAKELFLKVLSSSLAVFKHPRFTSYEPHIPKLQRVTSYEPKIPKLQKMELFWTQLSEASKIWHGDNFGLHLKWLLNYLWPTRTMVLMSSAFLVPVIDHMSVCRHFTAKIPILEQISLSENSDNTTRLASWSWKYSASINRV